MDIPQPWKWLIDFIFCVWRNYYLEKKIIKITKNLRKYVFLVYVNCVKPLSYVMSMNLAKIHVHGDILVFFGCVVCCKGINFDTILQQISLKIL